MLTSKMALCLALLASAISVPPAAAEGVVIEPVAAPVNDKPVDAVAIGAKQLTVEDSLKYATGDAGAPLHGKSDLRTVWYKITNADPGNYILTLNGISDGAIGVWLDPLNPDSPGEWIKLEEDTAIPVLGSSDKVTAVGFSTKLTGKTIYIQVGNPKTSSASRFSLDIFRLGTQPDKPFIVTPQNRAIVGTGQYNGSMAFMSPSRYVVNIGDTDITLNKSTTLASSGIDLGEKSTHLPKATAMLAKLSATGGGPRFGETGQWQEKLTFTAVSAGKTLGSASVPVTLVRVGSKISGPTPLIELKPNGGTSKMGDSQKLTLMITNRAAETMRGCSVAIMRGDDVWFAPYQFTYKQISLVSGNVVGDPNRIFNVKPNTAVRLDLALRTLQPTANSLIVPLLMCAETTETAQTLLGESTAYMKTYVGGPASAKVTFPALKSPRSVSIAKSATATVSVSVTNNGPKRSLTLLGMNSFFAQANQTPISFKFCADQAGICAKDPITSMKVTFDAGETRKFLVKIKRSSEAMTNDLAANRGYVMVFEGDKYVSMAGFGVKPK